MSIKLKKKMPKNMPFMSDSEMEVELEFDTIEEMDAYFELEKRAFQAMMGNMGHECSCSCEDDFDDYDDDDESMEGQVSFEELIAAIRGAANKDNF